MLSRLLNDRRIIIPLAGPVHALGHRPLAKRALGRGLEPFTEIEPDDPDIAWGICNLGMGFSELGTVRLSELASVRGKLGLGIERDLHFKADKPISAYIEEANRVGHIKA